MCDVLMIEVVVASLEFLLPRESSALCCWLKGSLMLWLWRLNFSTVAAPTSQPDSSQQQPPRRQRRQPLTEL